jgi:hypothetical protein
LQWAAIAVEADEVVEAIRQAAKERQGKRNDLTLDNKLSEVKKEHETKAATKIAQTFNTNRTRSQWLAAGCLCLYLCVMIERLNPLNLLGSAGVCSLFHKWNGYFSKTIYT